jgi:glutathione S-transferase
MEGKGRASTHGGANISLQVVHVMEELGVPYELKYLERGECKLEPYVKINPNGRVPGMQFRFGLHGGY